jgi:peptidoglycan/xylan/chitin deacetylase (PgdA/CDA1 family)
MTNLRKHLGWITVTILAAGCGMDDVEDEPPPFDEDLNGAYEEQRLDDGSADSARCSGVLIPDRSGFGKKIALTFDDGPSLTKTPEVLDILARHGARATFFVNGSNATSDAHRELLRRMVAEGHIVGNHTWSHVDARTVSESTLRSQVDRTRQVLEEVGIQPAFFRFPFGSASCRTAEIVRGYGYKITGWHIDTADWCFASPTGGVGYCSPRTFRYVPDAYRGDFIGYTLSQARANGGGVLLMHDVHRFTVDHLDALLTALENDGFTFTGLDDVTTFPQLNGQAPPAPPAASWIGTPCARDAQCDFWYGEKHGYCRTFVESETGTERGFCSLACSGYCPDRSGFAPTFCVELDNPDVGECAAKAADANRQCQAIPGTAARSRDRFRGTSGAPPATATVCVP